MLSMIKEIGIFVIIAQAILCFVPKETYAKYVKVLIGIMIVAQMASPVFSLLRGDAWDEIIFQGELLSKELEKQQNVNWGNDSYGNLMMHYSEMAEEQNKQSRPETSLGE